MSALVTTSLPAGVLARLTPDAAIVARNLCVRNGKYDGAQVARLFVAASRRACDTPITAADIRHAWEEVGIEERQVARAVGFYGVY